MPELIVTDSSYRFVPPQESWLVPRLLNPLVPAMLRRGHGVTRVELRGVETLAELIRARHGVVVAPNHSRMTDPLVVLRLCWAAGRPYFVMASSHLFRGSKLLAWALRKAGAFSVDREGVDRDTVKASIDILLAARRPLVIFPEGALSQANDRLNALMDGVSFIASAAAKALAKQSEDGEQPQGRKIVTLPVAIKYLFKGDVHKTVEPMLADIERRLAWRPQDHLSLVERVLKVGGSLLGTREMEYFGETRTGTLEQRVQNMIDHLLEPLEREWIDEELLQRRRLEDEQLTLEERGDQMQRIVIARVKELRKAVIPDMIEGQLSAEERQRRLRQLDDMERAQQLSLYPPRYVVSKPTVDRILETVARFQENLSGEEKIHPPTTAVVQVGEPIEVSPRRKGDGSPDLLSQVEAQLTEMLGRLAEESPLFDAAAAAAPEPKMVP